MNRELHRILITWPNRHMAHQVMMNCRAGMNNTALTEYYPPVSLSQPIGRSKRQAILMAKEYWDFMDLLRGTPYRAIKVAPGCMAVRTTMILLTPMLY